MQIFLLILISFQTVSFGNERWNFSRSARIAGLGESSSSIRDPGSILYNPAVSMLFKDNTLEISFSDYFSGIFKFGSIHYVTGDNSRKFFISLSYIFSDKILYTIYKDTTPAQNISEIEEKGYISANSVQILTGISKKIKNFYMGISLRIFREDLYVGKGYGISADAGLIYQKDFIFSFSIRNITGGYNFWDSGRKELIPPVIRTGFSKVVLKKFLISSDIEFEYNKKITINPHMGIEFSPNKKIFLRTGWRENIPTFGAGFLIKKLNIDYAIGGNFELSFFHIFSLTFRF